MLAQTSARYSSIDVNKIKLYTMEGKIKDMGTKENGMFEMLEGVLKSLPASLEGCPEIKKR